MAVEVVDRTSNSSDQIVHAAEVIGPSKLKQGVFRAVYTNQRRRKTVEDLITATKSTQGQVIDAGRTLAHETIITRTPHNGVFVYGKVDFFRPRAKWQRVLRLAADKKAREKVPTKRNPKVSPSSVKVNLRLPSQRTLFAQIFVDDIDSFAKVRRQPKDPGYTKMPETKFKRGVTRILGEAGHFKDWGGETSDLQTGRLIYKKKRASTAFAFKGPGTTGILTPGKMGKNGDQLQRLAQCPVDVFVVQYWGQIGEAVLHQLRELVLHSIDQSLPQEVRRIGVTQMDDTSLARVERLLAMLVGAALKDERVGNWVLALDRAGFKPAEIAELTGDLSNTIAQQLVRARRGGGKAKRRSGAAS